MSVRSIKNGQKTKVAGLVVPPKASDTQFGTVKMTDSIGVTQMDSGLVLSAIEKNPSIEGTIAHDISSLNENLGDKYIASRLESGSIHDFLNNQIYNGIRAGNVYCSNAVTDLPKTAYFLVSYHVTLSADTILFATSFNESEVNKIGDIYIGTIWNGVLSWKKIA